MFCEATFKTEPFKQTEGPWIPSIPACRCWFASSVLYVFFLSKFLSGPSSPPPPFIHTPLPFSTSSISIVVAAALK